MEDVLNLKEDINLLDINESKSSKEEFYVDESTNINVKIGLSEQNLAESFEDSSSWLNNFFEKKDTLLVEKWLKIETIHGKIIDIIKNEVFVDCIVDLEEKIFEHRSFPIILFDNLKKIEPEKTVLIKTSIKVGSVRLDVFPGDGIVNLDLFQSKEDWDKLTGSGLDTKLTEW